MILATAKVLQDARHAVLRTLYSRAHRVVWDVISYLLRGLCESLSLDLFFAMPVSVLACPALELLVLLEQQLEGLADDVGRLKAPKGGVAPDHFTAFPASKLCVAPCATSVLPTISPDPWVTRSVTGRVTCVFHAPVTFPRQKRRLNLTRIFAPLPLQRPQKQKM